MKTRKLGSLMLTSVNFVVTTLCMFKADVNCNSRFLVVAINCESTKKSFL